MIADMTAQERSNGLRCPRCKDVIWADPVAYELHMIRHELHDLNDIVFGLSEIVGSIGHGRR